MTPKLVRWLFPDTVRKIELAERQRCERLLCWFCQHGDLGWLQSDGPVFLHRSPTSKRPVTCGATKIRGTTR